MKKSLNATHSGGSGFPRRALCRGARVLGASVRGRRIKFEASCLLTARHLHAPMPATQGARRISEIPYRIAVSDTLPTGEARTAGKSLWLSRKWGAEANCAGNRDSLTNAVKKENERCHRFVYLSSRLGLGDTWRAEEEVRGNFYC